MKALVVDDSRVMRTLLTGLLADAGFEVATAENGTDALRWLAYSPRPDLFLVDWNMPEMNGVDFIRELRTRPAYATSRVVMVTTETSVHCISEALAAGADEYLMKPFLRDALASKLQQLGLPITASPAPTAPGR